MRLHHGLVFALVATVLCGIGCGPTDPGSHAGQDAGVDAGPIHVHKTTACDAGYHLSASGACVANAFVADAGAPHDLRSPGIGHTPEATAIECAYGFAPDRNGGCVRIVCASGSVLDPGGSGECIPIKPAVAPLLVGSFKGTVPMRRLGPLPLQSHVYGVILPSWKRATGNVGRVIMTKAGAAIPGLGDVKAADTTGVGIGCNVSVLSGNASVQTLLVWDDSGNVGIASGFAWGGSANLNLGGVGCGVVLMFSNANTIFDLKGASLTIGPAAYNLGVAYLEGKNQDGSAYFGLEIDLMGSETAPLPNAGVIIPQNLLDANPSFGASTTTSTFDVTPLNDFFQWVPSESDIYSLYGFDFDFGGLLGGF